MPLLLGCGSNNTSDVCHFLKTEDLSGFDGILVVCPFYNKPTQEGLYQHFKAISEASPLPIVLYNVPGRTGVNLTAQTTLRIAQDCKNVVAIKEASGKIEQIEDIVDNAPEGFDVIRCHICYRQCLPPRLWQYDSLRTKRRIYRSPKTSP